MFEAPLIVLWCFVPYWMLGLRRRPDQEQRSTAIRHS